MDAIDRRARRGLAWSAAASGVLGALDVVATLVLLRHWLGPADYGLAVLATSLYPLCDLLADGGVGAALVQRQRIDAATIATAWALAGRAARRVALGVVIVAPGLALIHGAPVVGALLAAYGAKLLLQPLATVPLALLRGELAFAAVARIKMAAALAEFGGKLGAAALGLGVWCFPIAALAKVGAQIVGAQRARPCPPRGRLDPEIAGALAGVARPVTASQVLVHLYSNADYQLVALAFGAHATGLYRAAYELVLEPAKILSYVVVDVAFPVYCRLAGDRAALRAQLIAFTVQNLRVLVPVLGALAIVPGDLLALAFGEPWRAAADAVRILCVVGGLRALSYLLPPLLDGVGQATRTLRYTVVAAIAVPCAQVLAIAVAGDALGWRAVAVAWAVAYPVAFALLLALVAAAIDLPVRRYLVALAPVVGDGALAIAAGLGARAVAPSAPLPRLALVGGAIALVSAARWRARRGS